MCVIIRQAYKVTPKHAELLNGSRFRVRRTPIKAGQLALFKVGRVLALGRMFENFIVQPSRWIHIANLADVQIVGAVA